MPDLLQMLIFLITFDDVQLATQSVLLPRLRHVPTYFTPGHAETLVEVIRAAQSNTNRCIRCCTGDGMHADRLCIEGHLVLINKEFKKELDNEPGVLLNLLQFRASTMHDRPQLKMLIVNGNV